MCCVFCTVCVCCVLYCMYCTLCDAEQVSSCWTSNITLTLCPHPLFFLPVWSVRCVWSIISFIVQLERRSADTHPLSPPLSSRPLPHLFLQLFRFSLSLIRISDQTHQQQPTTGVTEPAGVGCRDDGEWCAEDDGKCFKVYFNLYNKNLDGDKEDDLQQTTQEQDRSCGESEITNSQQTNN